MAEDEEPTRGDGQAPEARTELIPAVETGEGIASTRQLPAVQEPVAPPPPARPPRQPPAAVPVGATPAGERRSVSLRNIALALVAIALVAILGIAIGRILPGGSDDSAGGSKSSSGSSKPLAPDISSYDPSGGSGFRRSGNAWVTQTYTSATFGNLKDGVGLVLDLGEKSGVAGVSFTADGATVELRAADSEAQFDDGYVQVGSTTTASGATTLSGSGGGDHRYWIIWVSQLGRNDGFSARISDIQVTAS